MVNCVLCYDFHVFNRLIILVPSVYCVNPRQYMGCLAYNYPPTMYLVYNCSPTTQAHMRNPNPAAACKSKTERIH